MKTLLISFLVINVILTQKTLYGKFSTYLGRGGHSVELKDDSVCILSTRSCLGGLKTEKVKWWIVNDSLKIKSYDLDGKPFRKAKFFEKHVPNDSNVVEFLVMDGENNKKLLGVGIAISGTRIGAPTDINGKAIIKISNFDNLRIGSEDYGIHDYTLLNLNTNFFEIHLFKNKIRDIDLTYIIENDSTLRVSGSQDVFLKK